MTNVFTLRVFIIFMQQDYINLIFKETYLWRVEFYYHIHFEAQSIHNG